MKICFPPIGFFLLLFSTSTNNCFAQTVTGGINSGAFTGSTLMHSVGEIYVIPDGNPDEASSGIIGMVSALGFFTGLETVMMHGEPSVYPNPASVYTTLSIPAGPPVQYVSIHDSFGRVVSSQELNGSLVDLQHLPPGIYLIVTDRNDISPLRIVKF